ncbi:MAG: ATP synthase F0 subunit B [Desulfurivibrionaceae bacterium]|nr:ATP synthase F0 subunit B [Desulfobulbales bacterium]MDT8334774.1 ATP synthase F0 subunit B [Desulfurivibrionaceae bacterium]
MKMIDRSGWTSVCIAAFLIFCASLAHASGGEGGIPKEKWMDLLWRTLNFAGLLIILVWALKKPIANALTSRRRGIIEKFEDLEAQKREAERIYKEYEAKLTGIEQEVQAIIRSAVQQGEAEKARIIDEANRAAEDIQRQAEMAVQHELAGAKLRLRSEIAEQAVRMAEDLLKQNLKETDQAVLVEDYLEKVGALQ